MLCLHGLTRNSRDFAALAGHIAPARRVIVPDQRGRGRCSTTPQWLNYHPRTYVDDMWALLRELSIERVDRRRHFARRSDGDADGRDASASRSPAWC